jgi:predicted dehydrogenase
MRTPVALGLVGGHPLAEEIALAFEQLPRADVRWLCGEWRATGISRRIRVRPTERFDELLDDEVLDAVVVASPVGDRYRFAALALEADKHVYVAGAPARQSDQANGLAKQAQDRGRHFLAGDPVLWDPALEELESLLRSGALGEILYLHAELHSCGRAPNEDDLLWGPGAQAVALILHLLGDEPVSVDARGERFLDPTTFDVLRCSLSFATGITAHVALSALDACPASRLAVVTSEATAVFDSSAGAPFRLVVYRKARDGSLADGTLFSPGEVVSPQVGREDPVRRSCEAFLSTTRSPSVPAGAGREASILVETLEGIQRSLARGGLITLGTGRLAKDLRLVGEPSVT